jgi:hypothetical protein
VTVCRRAHLPSKLPCHTPAPSPGETCAVGPHLIHQRFEHHHRQGRQQGHRAQLGHNRRWEGKPLFVRCPLHAKCRMRCSTAARGACDGPTKPIRPPGKPNQQDY